MKKILVTGCNGQLGRAINQEYGNEAEFINTDVQAGDGAIALDITKVEDVLALVRETKPDVIINCAQEFEHCRIRGRCKTDSCIDRLCV